MTVTQTQWSNKNQQDLKLLNERKPIGIGKREDKDLKSQSKSKMVLHLKGKKKGIFLELEGSKSKETDHWRTEKESCNFFARSLPPPIVNAQFIAPFYFSNRLNDTYKNNQTLPFIHFSFSPMCRFSFCLFKSCCHPFPFQFFLKKILLYFN